MIFPHAVRGLQGRSQFLEIILLVLFALLLRLFFYVGVGGDESLKIAETDWSIVDAVKHEIGSAIRSLDVPALFDGGKDLAAEFGIQTLIVYAPLSLLYIIGGVNDITSTFWPLFCSLFTVVIIYALAKLLFNEKTALLAGLFWAVLPLDIFLSTVLLPTVPLVFLFASSVFLFLSWERDKSSWSFYCGLFAAIVLFYADTFLGFVLALLCLIAYLWKRHNRPKSFPLLGVLLLAGLVIGVLQVGGQDIVYTFLLEQPEAVLLLPLVFIVLPFSVWRFSQQNGLLLLWFGVSAIGFLLRFAQSPGMQMIEDPFLIMSFFPLAMLAAGYFAHVVSQLTYRSIIWVALLTLATACLAIKGQERLIVSFKGYGWISLASLMYVLRILGGIVFVALVASSAIILPQKRKAHGSVGIILLTGLVLALIPSMWERVEAERSRIGSMQQVFQAVEASPEYPVYILNDREILRQFDYQSQYSGEYLMASSKMDVIGSDELDLVESGYLIYWDDYLDEAPATWWQVGTYGDLGHSRLVMARTLSSEEADAQMVQATIESEKVNSARNYMELYAAALNGGELCVAYDAWIKARSLQAADWAYIPVDPKLFRNCFSVEDQINLLGSPPLPTHGGYIQAILMASSEGPHWELRVSNKYSFFYDPRVFDIRVTLEAGKIYLYSVTVQNREPAALLYWSVSDTEGYLDVGRFPEWQTRAMLLSSPLLGNSFDISLSPILIDNFGDVFIKDAQFIPISLDTN